MQNRPRRLGVPFFQIPTVPNLHNVAHAHAVDRPGACAWRAQRSRLMSDGARAVARVWTAEENFADFELRNGCNRQI